MISMLLSGVEMLLFHSYIRFAKGKLMFADFIRLPCAWQSFYPERVRDFVSGASQSFFATIFVCKRKFHTHMYVYIYIIDIL